jgi:opacity protein-like surface antigen
MKSKKTLLVTITVLTFFLFSAVLVSAADAAETKCPKTIKVEVKKIAGQQFEEFKSFKAAVFPEISVVKTLVSGVVTDVKVSEGNLVSKNLEMLVIDEALAKQIKNLEAELKKNRKTLRSRQGWKERSKKAEQQAERWVKESEAKLAEKKAAVANYIIAAPMDGIIKSLKAVKDEKISEGAVIAEIENTGRMFARVQVTGEDLALFSQGQEIAIAFEEVKGTFAAVVTEISGNEILLTIENKVKDIKENYTLVFKLLKKVHQDAILVDKPWLLNDDAGDYIYKVEGKYAKRANVKITSVTGRDCLIAEGLSGGDEIIVSEIRDVELGAVKDQLECIRDGVKIKAMEIDPETGKYVKRKPGVKKEAKKEVVKKQVVKKEVVKKEKPVKVKKPKVKKEKTAAPSQNYFMAGVGPGIFHVNQTWWAEVYSKANFGFGFKLAYVLQNKYELFGEFNYARAKGEIIPTGEETKFTNMPIYLGAKYLFNLGAKFVPFVGVAGVVKRVTEDNVIAKASMNEFGFSIMAGTYFDITDQLSLDLCMKYDKIEFSIEGTDIKPDMSGARLFLMFTYKFKK